MTLSNITPSKHLPDEYGERASGWLRQVGTITFHSFRELPVTNGLRLHCAAYRRRKRAAIAPSKHRAINYDDRAIGMQPTMPLSEHASVRGRAPRTGIISDVEALRYPGVRWLDGLKI
jgi:hypothetical protein